jgi:hypothetical protein
MDSDFSFVTAKALQTNTALYTASIAFIAIGLIAEFFVKLFGNWFLLFHRFKTRLLLWVGIGGISAYLGLFFLAQADPTIRGPFFYWAHDFHTNKTGADWVLPVLILCGGAMGCMAYMVGCIDWLFFRGASERAKGVVGRAKRFFITERLLMVGLQLLCLPGFFVLFCSLWSPLMFNDDVLLRYFCLMEKTLDGLTFGFFDSYKINLVSLGQASSKLSSTESWLYQVLIAVIVIPVIIDIARYGWNAAHKRSE